MRRSDDSDDGLSSDDDFFRHPDFKFATESENSEGDNPDENSFSLVLYNKMTHQGNYFLGMVKLHVGNRLPMGKRALQLKTRLVIKSDPEIEDSTEEIVQKFLDSKTSGNT